MDTFMDTPIRDILILVSENLLDSDQKAPNPSSEIENTLSESTNFHNTFPQNFLLIG